MTHRPPAEPSQLPSTRRSFEPFPHVDDAGRVEPMTDRWLDDTRDSYDADAAAYAEQVRGLLDVNPYLRASLGLFADLVSGAGGGPVADVGCGPGYVTRHLHDLGLDAFGIDLSPEMVAIARRDHPHLRFERGSMMALDVAERSLAGLVAFWSVIHVPDRSVPAVFDEFRRTLRPGGTLPSVSTWETRSCTPTRATRAGPSASTAIVDRRPWWPDGCATLASRSTPSR